MCVLPVLCACLVPMEGTNVLELELWIVASPHVGAESSPRAASALNH